jgi:hypothetical protein
MFEFGNDSCDTFDKGCTNGFVCHDFTFKGQHIGTDCGPSGTAFTAASCSGLECPELLECYERIVDGRGGLAQCAFRHTVDLVSEEIKSLLENLPNAAEGIYAKKQPEQLILLCMIVTVLIQVKMHDL